MDSLNPAVVTGALFASLILLDLLRHDYELLPGHTFFGIFCVLSMSILVQYGYSNTGWGLLAIPFVILFIGLAMQSMRIAPLRAYPR